MSAKLFSPLKLRSLTSRNRIFVSPMCQYSATEGVPNNWHLVHLGARAVGGAGVVIVEATGVVPEGRISPGCLGLWNDEQVKAFQPITKFIKEYGALPGIQLAHAGRKASTDLAWNGGGALTPAQGGWTTVGPSALAFSEKYSVPHELTVSEIKDLVSAFVKAAERSLAAGFQVIELHMAHGYLFHEFLSPLSNKRTDEYGGSLENRLRFPLEVSKAVRAVWPADLPLFVRLSASDWTEGGWDVQSSIELTKELQKLGVDFLDCSSGGNVPAARIPPTPGYQVEFAQEIRKATGVLTGAVGLITEAQQAEAILQEGKADAILLARELLRDPHWPLHAASELGVDVKWPLQYERAKV